MDILKDGQYKSYDKLSRYSIFPIYYNTEDNKWQSALTAYLDDNTSYFIHKVVKNDTYDNIALRYYNNPTYYWIICSFNHIQDPFEQPTEGTRLKIPSISNIQFDI